MTRFALTVVLLAACGGDDGGGVVADAKMADTASANAVVPVTCPATADAVIMTTNASFQFMPMSSTVPTSAVIKFAMSSDHNVIPNPLATLTDPGLTVGFGETKCLKFTHAGTYGFACGPHGFVGTVTVN